MLSKDTIASLTSKWGSWNVCGFNKFSSSAAGVEATYFLIKEERLLDEMNGFHLHRLRCYSIEHGYWEYDVRFEDAVVAVRAAAGRDGVAFEFTPVSQTRDVLVGGMLAGSFGGRPKIRKAGDALKAVSQDGRTFNLFLIEGDAAVDEGMIYVPILDRAHMVLTDADSKDRFASAESVTAFIDGARDRYLRATADRTEEMALARRLVNAIPNFNAVYLPQLGEVVCVASRAWSVGPIWGGYVIFPWNAMFSGLMASLESRQIAYANLFAVLHQAEESGMLPGSIGGYYTTKDRAITPVESLISFTLYSRFGDREFLQEAYPALKNSIQFYINNCDGNGDGLYEWYSFPWKMTRRERARLDKVSRLLLLGTGTGTMQGARYSSGQDNSPTFDDIEFDEKSHTMKMADVGLNALLATEAECLHRIAGILGCEADARYFLDFSASLKRLIQENLWDEDAGIYKSRTWDGRFVEALAPMNFWPMLAGIPTEEQAERMVREHLLNPEEFWGDYVIPSIARDHPSFQDQDYWRGRVWGSTNYLTVAGLRRYGYDREADEVSARSGRLVLKEYYKDFHIHEHYSAIDGNGDDVNVTAGKIKSHAYFPYGALLLFLHVEEAAYTSVFAGEAQGAD